MKLSRLLATSVMPLFVIGGMGGLWASPGSALAAPSTNTSLTHAAPRTVGASEPALGHFKVTRPSVRNHVRKATNTTEVVRAGDLATGFSDPNLASDWFFYNDENDTIDETLGSFVHGPGVPAHGFGSARISVSGTERRNLATYQFAGTPLASITTMKYTTYNPSAGNGGSSQRSAYLNFNVDFTGTSNSFQRRLAFLPDENGTVTQDNWKEWDTIRGGNAVWACSCASWPSPGSGSGSTPMTWNQLLSTYPGIRILPASAPAGPWLGLRVGEPYSNGYTENIDSFTFGTSAGTTVFDFEPTGPITVCPTGPADYSTIQAAINAAPPGDTISLCAATFVENVDVSTPVTITGAGQGSTIVEPAISDPNPGCGDGSCIDGGSSNVFRIQANNVTIEHLTVDGNNPSISSGDTAGGVDIDARNGIITDHDLPNSITGLTVSHVTVKNIWQRGIQASTYGGTFDFNHDAVSNVQGDPLGSIAMFNYEGSGNFSNNTVSNVTDGIHSNWTSGGGVTMVDNTVTHALTGLETDNGGELGDTVAISGNSVTCSPTGYGVVVFAPFGTATVSDNSITDCQVGLGSFSSNSDSRPYTAPLITFSGNTVNGENGIDSIGALVTPDKLGYGYDDTNDAFTGNLIENSTNSFATVVGDIFGYGDGSGGTITLSAHFNRIVNNTAPFSPGPTGGFFGTGGSNGWYNPGATPNATDNWWGCNSGPNHGSCDTTSGGVTSSPWLVLRFNSSVSRLAPGTSTTLTGDLTHDSFGTDTSGSGNLPDGTPVTFAINTGDGHLSSCDSATTGGQAVCTFTAPSAPPSPDTTNLTASVDAATLSLNVLDQYQPVLSWADPSPISYGTALTAAQLDASADVPGVFAFAPTVGTVLPAGSHQLLSATFTPADTVNNASAGTASAHITVNPALLVIRAVNKTVVYGHAMPSFTFVGLGFVNGDSASSFTTQPTCGTTATQLGGNDTSGAGAYPITCSGAVDPNYSIMYAAGTLQVKRAGDKLTWVGASTFHKGSRAVLKATLTTLGNGPVQGRSVAMTLGGQLCAGITDATGLATCTINKVKAAKGTRMVTLTFPGDSDYVPVVTAVQVHIQ